MLSGPYKCHSTFGRHKMREGGETVPCLSSVLLQGAALSGLRTFYKGRLMSAGTRKGAGKREEGERVISKTDFKAMNAYEKGFVVYMHGCRKEQPNIPKSFPGYTKGVFQKRYKQGEMAAYIAVLDVEG